MDFSFPSKGSTHAPHIRGEEEGSSKTQKNYREIISTLPTDDGWKAAEPFCQYQGFWHFPSFLEGVMSTQENFIAQPTDIFVCSAPKSGTTWLKALTFAILTRKHFDDSTNPLLTTIPHECIPFLEVDVIDNPSHRKPGLPLLATHFPHPSLPKSIISLGCKLVYICRDPKDVFISMWQFAGKLTPNKQPIPLDEAFDMFCKGVSFFGPHWEHALGYWKASLEWPEKVMFIKYEDLMRDTSFYVKRIAEFMGYPFSLEEETGGAVEKIVKLCSFETLSNLEVNKKGEYRPGNLHFRNNDFFRKGKVGDWQNYLTAEMVKRLDQMTEQKLSRFGLTF